MLDKEQEIGPEGGEKLVGLLTREKEGFLKRENVK